MQRTLDKLRFFASSSNPRISQMVHSIAVLLGLEDSEHVVRSPSSLRARRDGTRRSVDAPPLSPSPATMTQTPRDNDDVNASPRRSCRLNLPCAVPTPLPAPLSQATNSVSFTQLDLSSAASLMPPLVTFKRPKPAVSLTSPTCKFSPPLLTTTPSSDASAATLTSQTSFLLPFNPVPALTSLHSSLRRPPTRTTGFLDSPPLRRRPWRIRRRNRRRETFPLDSYPPPPLDLGHPTAATSPTSSFRRVPAFSTPSSENPPNSPFNSSTLRLPPPPHRRLPSTTPARPLASTTSSRRYARRLAWKRARNQSKASSSTSSAPPLCAPPHPQPPDIVVSARRAPIDLEMRWKSIQIDAPPIRVWEELGKAGMARGCSGLLAGVRGETRMERRGRAAGRAVETRRHEADTVA
ncbi:hypothetical protein R3P38DRAFT_3612903 [Favolaschia claudopus]|uniref:Uncharacterized protein n=1 Tax=Favolaschia claudopus TaxID=2862362 RepID=A0AAW0A5Y0_9AGAR